MAAAGVTATIKNLVSRSTLKNSRGKNLHKSRKPFGLLAWLIIFSGWVLTHVRVRATILRVVAIIPNVSETFE
jgi:hypothetical protein